MTNLKMLDGGKVAARKRILVVGDAILDYFIYGSATRIAAEAPIPVVLRGSEKYLLGGAANVAANLTSLGCSVDFVSAIAKDDDGFILKHLLDDAQVNCIFETIDVTPKKTRVVADNQYIVRVDNEIIKPCTTIANMIDSLKSSYDAIMISDYNKGVISKEVVESLKLKNVNIFVDPRPANADFYHNVHMMCPNKYEVQDIIGKKLPPDKAVRELKDQFKLTCSIVTASQDGVYLVDESNNVRSIPSHKLTKDRSHKIDVTGAGDTLFSVFVLCYCNNFNIFDSALIANVAAAIVVNKIGTSICTLLEIQQEINIGDLHETVATKFGRVS